jgi:hypothetical protein
MTEQRTFKMGIDWVPATIKNEVSEDFVLIILDGNIEGSPTPENFQKLTYQKSSTDLFKSIDAFGVYFQGKPVQSFYSGVSSHWWRISDGTECSITLNEEEELELVIHKYLSHMPLPRPSSPEFWGYLPGELSG